MRSFIYAVALLVTLPCFSKNIRWKGADFSYSYPAHWQLDNTPSSPCLRLKKEVRSFQEILEICKYRIPWKKVIGRTVFQFDNGTWVAFGSMDTQKVKAVHNHNSLFILETKAPTSCGITVDEVFHAAAGQCYSSLVSRGAKTILVRSNGESTEFGEMRRLTRSIRIN